MPTATFHGMAADAPEATTSLEYLTLGPLRSDTVLLAGSTDWTWSTMWVTFGYLARAGARSKKVLSAKSASTMPRTAAMVHWNSVRGSMSLMS
jgi:hypothetical protein